MIEVFKTNVENQQQADVLLKVVHHSFVGYRANFDLSDCDRILRIQSTNGAVQPQLIIELLKEHGFEAAVLPDEITTTSRQSLVRI
ncbi:MAG: hypothetical protein QM802_06295 [Agriterribacter sp.]